MSYQALYRKYRPSTLKDVIGQDVVIKILENAVINDRVGHAYLFSGPRGIGKTTIAKALAKTVNCLSPENGCSCEKCTNCKIINSSFCPDIIEIDAASNNGVDEIREIKNKINLVPNELKYKVYIIDEVHMLSIGAFNALLKTLEEPPEHVIFILATTDPQKVPSTIISRCQCYEFHRISNADIIKRLNFICENEKIKIENDVLNKIADLSDGGLRDSIGMLDKLIAYTNDKITLDDFEKVNGIVSNNEKNKFIEYIYNCDALNIIKFIDDIYDNGKNLIIFTQDLLQMCKDKCVDYYVNNTSENIEFLLSLSNMLNNIMKDIKTSPNVKTILEISLLSFINNNSQKNVKKVENVVKEVDTVEKNISQEIICDSEDKNDSLNQIDFKQIINNCFARANKQEKQMFENKWKLINDYALDNKFGAAASFVSDGKIRVVGENELIISFAYESMVNRGINLIDLIQNLFEKIYNKQYDIAFITDDEWIKIKNEYINNKNNGINYEYVPIERKKKAQNGKLNNNLITNEAIELFGDNVVLV